MDAKKFGLLIDVEKIKDFKQALNDVSDNFKKKLEGKSGKSELGHLIEGSKKELIEYMMTVDEENILLEMDSNLSSINELGDEEKAKVATEAFVMNKLKFPLIKDLIENIDIESYTVDISDELIHENADFKKIMEAYEKLDENGLQIRVYLDEFEKE